MAAATRCARVLVPVLAIALRTCVLTVSVVTNRSSAISRLVAPSATRPMTSSSRGVSGAGGRLTRRGAVSFVRHQHDEDDQPPANVRDVRCVAHRRVHVAVDDEILDTVALAAGQHRPPAISDGASIGRRKRFDRSTARRPPLRRDSAAAAARRSPKRPTGSRPRCPSGSQRRRTPPRTSSPSRTEAGRRRTAARRVLNPCITGRTIAASLAQDAAVRAR